MGRLSGLPLDLWPTDSVYHSTREAEEKEGGQGGLREHHAGEQSDPKLHLHAELLELSRTTSGKHSLNYDIITS